MSDNIKIDAKDFKRVYSVCDNILRKDEGISECIRNLSANLRKIEGAWSSDGADRESYTKGLTNEIEKLERLNGQVVTFCRYVTKYINSLEQQSKRTLD